MGIGINEVNGIGRLDNGQGAAQKKQSSTAENRAYDNMQDTYVHVEQTQKTGSTGKVQLSDKAQKVLEGLKKKFANTDIYVADYSTDEEASQILSNSTNEFGAVITPEELEKMAEDDSYLDKITGTISDSEDQLKEFKSGLSEKEQGSVTGLGFSIGKYGIIKYFAQLGSNGNKSQAQAASLTEMSQIIKDFIADSIKADDQTDVQQGQHVDYQA
jgi:hypothetical protein